MPPQKSNRTALQRSTTMLPLKSSRTALQRKRLFSLLILFLSLPYHLPPLSPLLPLPLTQLCLLWTSYPLSGHGHPSSGHAIPPLDMATPPLDTAIPPLDTAIPTPNSSKSLRKSTLSNKGTQVKMKRKGQLCFACYVLFLHTLII